MAPTSEADRHDPHVAGDDAGDARRNHLRARAAAMAPQASRRCAAGRMPPHRKAERSTSSTRRRRARSRGTGGCAARTKAPTRCVTSRSARTVARSRSVTGGVRFWDGGAWLGSVAEQHIPHPMSTSASRGSIPSFRARRPRLACSPSLLRATGSCCAAADPTVSYTALWGSEQGVLVAAGARLGAQRRRVVCARRRVARARSSPAFASSTGSRRSAFPPLALAVSEGVPRDPGRPSKRASG